MGKADMSRDYYADLEVQPTADLVEIKKQFKKLALKWHPDRNPGRETEVNAKFQVIQSAHEILTDEVERRRYDAGRLRTTRFSSAPGGTRGNPYANAGSQWAPPPKPFGTPRASAAGQGTSGASKYQKFHTEGTHRSTPNPPQDQETKKNFYHGFERMRKPNQPNGTFARTSGTSSPNGRSPKVPEPSSSQFGRERPPPPPKPGKPASEEWNTGEMPGRKSPKKAGFMPGNPDGDEPAAPRTSAYSSGRSNRAPTATSMNPPAPPPRPKGFERLHDPTVDGVARQRTPYATQGGEKTNPFESSNIHRSNTTRERPNSKGYRTPDSPSPGSTRDKHRSASPPRSGPYEKPTTTFGTNSESPSKRSYSHANISPSTAGPTNREGNSSWSQPRFEAHAESDTSSEDEDSNRHGPPGVQPANNKLPRRAVPVQNVADNASRPNVSNDQQRKANPGDFRNTFGSGGPLLNSTGSGSSGNSKTSESATQPMYEQPSHHTLFSNFSPLPVPSPYRLSSGYRYIYSGAFRDVTADRSSEKLASEVPRYRTREETQSTVLPNDTSFTDTSHASRPRSMPYSDAAQSGSDPSSPRRRADDLSSFEKRMMSGLHRTFAKAEAQGLPGSNGAALDADVGRAQNIVFGHSTQLGFGRSVSSPLGTNLAGQTARDVPRSPKRKTGVDYNDVNHFTESPNKRATSFHEAHVSGTNGTNGVNHRFPAYRSQPSVTPPLFTAGHAETIDTTFETGKWNGQFGADSFVNPSQFSSGPSRPQAGSRAGSRAGRRSPTKAKSATGRTGSASASLHSDSTNSDQSGASAPPNDSPMKPFVPEAWNPAEFDSSVFAPPPSARRQNSRAKANKTAGSKRAVVEDYWSESANEETSAGNVGGPSTSAQPQASSPNAMDIDSPYDANGGQSKPAGEARNVPLEPLRPEWRAGASNGDSTTLNGASQNLDGAPDAKTINDDDFKTNFDEFKNVEPFYQGAHGLDSFSDIKSTLPFESMPSNSIPLSSEAPARADIYIPAPPTVPGVPSMNSGGTGRMSAASWQSYVVSFQTYLAEYELYKQKMESHDSARREQWNKLINSSGWGWLESRSDKVLNEWATNARYDRLIKEKSAEAAKKHELAMEEFQYVRGSMRGKAEETIL